MRAGNAADEMHGGPGNEDFYGGYGADYFSGSSKDRTTGGPDRDHLFGGPDDTIASQDGVRDVLNCGSGNYDSMVTVRELDILTNCEKLYWQETALRMLGF